jgi:hypothetical protein
MFENYERFLNISPSQNIFRWDSIRNDYYLIKGVASGQFIKDLYSERPDETLEFLDAVYDNEQSNQHTKNIVIEIKKYL